MARPTPFLFERDFHEKEKAAEPTVALSEHEAALAAAREEGRKEGFTAGRDEALASETARIADTCGRLAKELTRAVQTTTAAQSQREAEAVQLAVALAQKIGGAALARFPLADIEAAAESCFAEARQAPHVVMRVAPAFVEAVENRLNALAAERGFTGRLVVLGEPEVAPGDARVEWADGGIVRDRAATLSAIAGAVERHITARTKSEGK